MNRQLGVAGVGVCGQKTTSLRERVRSLLAKGLTVPEAARALQRPERTVRYHRDRLALDVADKKLPISPPVPEFGNGKEFYRPHDFTLSLPIHYASEGYLKKIKGKGNFARYRGHFVQFSRQTVVVRGKPGFGFSARDPEDALRLATVYWEGFVQRLGDRWGVVLFKPDCEFSMSYEVGEVGNDLAGELKRQKARVLVKDPLDGSTWLTFDFSPGVGEADTTHKITAGEDMVRLRDELAECEKLFSS